MKTLITPLLALTLIGCAATITITIKDPETGKEITKVEYQSARRALILVNGTRVDIVTGEIVLSDEAVRVLAPVIAGAVPDLQR